MATYIAVYNSSTKFIHSAFLRTTSDNVSTWKTDGHLDVDGVKVIESIESLGANVEAVSLTNPTALTDTDPPGVFSVDVYPSPTDSVERTDTPATGGSKTKDQLFGA